jgi:hypothetical protein
VADHLSRLQFEESAELPINDYMRDDTLLKVMVHKYHQLHCAWLYSTRSRQEKDYLRQQITPLGSPVSVSGVH